MTDLTPEVLAIHQWIRDDAPVSMKMTITPKLIEALAERIQAARVNDLCADASPCPHSPVSWDDAPAGVQLWGVYGHECFPTVFACKMLDYPSGMRAIWGFSVYRRQPGYRTLGQNKDWAEKNGLRLFLSREAAFASIAAYFPDGGEAVHARPLSAGEDNG